MNPIARQVPLRKVAQQVTTKQRAYSSFYPKVRVQMKVPRERGLSSTKHNNARHDESPIDFAYMPRDDFFPTTAPTEPRVPLLPDNFAPPLVHTQNAHHDFHIEDVVRPTISTVSADGTHIDSPSAMSEVVDNHAAEKEVDVFDLTKQVAVSAARKMEEVVIEETKQGTQGIRAFAGGVFEDVFGPRHAHA